MPKKPSIKKNILDIKFGNEAIKAKKKLGENNKVTNRTKGDSFIVGKIRKILKTKVKRPVKSLFKFVNDQGAAKHNSELILQHQNNLSEIFKDGTVTNPGYEFRSPTLLKELLGSHQDWEKMENTIVKGASYPFKNEEYSEEARKKDLGAAITRGNN